MATSKDTCSFLLIQIQTEQWRPIPGYETEYDVSSYGRVRRSIHAHPHRLLPTHHILTDSPTRKGYRQIRLKKRGQKRISMTVHRIVMLAFIGPSSLQVNHKNGIKPDNFWLNLEYVTNRENRLHSYYVLGNTAVFGGRPVHHPASGFRNGKYTKPEATPRGSKHGMSKLDEEKVKRARELFATGNYTQRSLAQVFNVSQVAIMRAVRGETWAHVV